METTLQKNIKNKLLKKNLSIAELERSIGLRYAVINILHGRSKNPSTRVALAIAKELDCSIEELLSEEAKSLPIDTEKKEHSLNDKMTEYICDTKIPWDPLLAKQSIDAINKYLQENNLTPSTTKIFYCIEEIYRYSYKNTQKRLDINFVTWIAEKTFIRNK